MTSDPVTAAAMWLADQKETPKQVIPANHIALAAIRTDGGTQSRASLSVDVVDEYAAAMAAGATFPKIIVFYDGSEHWLADGFHRHAAFVRNSVVDVDADVRQGTRRDAILYSVGANATHGLQRTRQDKRRAVMTLLEDSEWASWPNTKVAKACGVSEGFVRHLRTNEDIPTSDVRTVERNGTVYQQNTAAIGKPAHQSGYRDDAPKPGDISETPRIVEVDEDEITEEDLANDPGFQKAVEALNNAKALYDEVKAMPPAEPMTPEREANLKRAFGTVEDRSNLMAIINATKLLEKLPEPQAMAESVPPTMSHAVDVLAVLKLSDWFEQFARAWERREGASA